MNLYAYNTIHYASGEGSGGPSRMRRLNRAFAALAVDEGSGKTLESCACMCNKYQKLKFINVIMLHPLQHL